VQTTTNTLSHHQQIWKSWLKNSAPATVRAKDFRSRIIMPAHRHFLVSLLASAHAHSLVSRSDLESVRRALARWDAAPRVVRLAVLSFYVEMGDVVLEHGRRHPALLLDLVRRLFAGPNGHQH
jgi:hypothetical protein